MQSISGTTQSRRIRCAIRYVLFISLLAPGFVLAQNAEDHYRHGMQAGSLTEKIEHFGKAVALDSGFYAAVYQLGIAHYQKGEYPQAAQHLTRLINRDEPTFKDAALYLRNAYTFRARDLIAAQQYQDALLHVRQALELDSNYPLAHRVLGEIYCGQEIWQRCSEALQRSATLNPSQEDVWNQLGDLYLQEAAYHKAIQAYRRALALDPDLKDAAFHLKVAEGKNRPEIYLDKFDRAIRDGNLEQGIEILNQAQTVFPGNPEIEERLQLAIQARNYFAAMEAIERQDWSEAFDLLQSVDPEYRDTALKIEEVRAELILNESDSLLSKTAEEKADIDVAQINEEKKTPEAAELQALPPDEQQIANDETPDKIADPLPNKIEAGKDSLISALREYTLLPNTGAEAQPRPTEKATGMGWLLGGLLLLGLSVFGIVRYKDKLRFLLAKRLAEKQSSTDEFIRENLASETPVTFDPLDTAELLGKNTAHPNGSGEPHFLRESSPLHETRTIFGRVKKVQRIGRYILEKEIGRGSMGMVFKAWDPMLDRTVVIKQMAFDIDGHSTEIKRLRERLYREARAAGKLNHPNIVIIYDIEEDRNVSYLVMEFIDGIDLKHTLEKEGPFKLKKAVRIAEQICSALAFAHKNDIVHRDIKPSNILITADDTVKVADFGIAKLPQFGTLTQTGSVLGTPFYMSPEQIEGRKLDGRSDIFSLGVLFYELLTGRRPFQGDNLPAVVYKIIHKIPTPPSLENADLPQTVDEIIERALAKDEAARYATADDLLHDLRRLYVEPIAK